MKVNIDFAQYICVIEFEPFLGEDIKEYKKAFEVWYLKKKKNGCNVKVRPEHNYKVFDAQVIIDWLKIASPKCKARVIEPFLDIGEEDKDLPYMCF